MYLILYHLNEEKKNKEKRYNFFNVLIGKSYFAEKITQTL